MPDDSVAHDLAALAEDENRLERFAPSLVPLLAPTLRHCLLPALYVVLAIKSGVSVGAFLCATSPSLHYFWPSSSWVLPMLLECCFVLMLLFCAFSLQKRARLAAWMCWGCVLLRIGVTAWETFVRAEFLLRITTIPNRRLFDYCVLLPFEAIAPVVILAVFASKGCPPPADAGRCSKCGYITYGLGGSVCPECGTALAEPSQVA